MSSPGQSGREQGPRSDEMPEGEHEGHHPGDESSVESEFLPGTNLPLLLTQESLSPRTRSLIETRADEAVVRGRARLVAGLRRLADASDDELPAAVEEVRQGGRELSKGLAMRRSLVEAGPSRPSAMNWVRDDLDIRRPAAASEPSGGIGLFHGAFMAIAVVFIVAMLWMYFFKMRRAAALLQTLQAAAPVPGARVLEQPRRRDAWRGDLRVAAVFSETADVKTFRLVEPESSSVPFTYLPGQFLTLKVAPDGKTVQRSYTIASSPTQRDYVEITVKREAKGLVSRFLYDRIKPGDTLSVSAPSGRFTFTGQEADAIVLVAGGVGITPMMSVARYLTDRSWGGSIDMLVCTKAQSNVIFARELEALARRYESFRYTLVLSSPDDGWEGHRGRLNKTMISEIVPDVAKRRVHVCGPPAMMDAVTEMLVELGLDRGRIYTEKFGPAKRPSPKPAADAPPVPAPAATPKSPTVSFRASGKKTTLGPDLTILDAAESVGVEIESSCRVGTCGSCMVRLLEGEVEMPVEDGLHPDDKADGYVLACQAHAKGNVVVDA